MSDPFVAEIKMFGGNFAPKGWATCDGQILPIAQNTALFSLLGVMYGGNGQTTFALPNFQGSAPMQQGQGPGLSQYVQGQTGGSMFITLLGSEMPAHTHAMSASEEVINENNVANNWFGAGETRYVAPAALQTMAPLTVTIAGGGLPHTNLMPTLTVTFIIALQGIFPPRT